MNTILIFIIIVLIVIIVFKHISYNSYLKKNKNKFSNFNADSAKKTADRYNNDIITEYNIIIDAIRLSAERGDYSCTIHHSIQQKILTKLVQNGYLIEKAHESRYEIYWDNIFDKKN